LFAPGKKQGDYQVKITSKVALVALASLSPFAAVAQESSNPLPGSFTGNVALTNDYIFRGVTQTAHEAAIQGGLDWDTGMGFHFGTWASSLNFKDGNNATTEIDLYAGYGGAVGNFSYDVGFTYYWYPGSTNAAQYNFWEMYGKAGYDFGVASVGGYVAFTPANTITNLDATYTQATVTVPVIPQLSISGNLGYYFLEGLKDPTDWNIGATLSVYDWFDVDARYYDTDVNNNCLVGTIQYCDARFVVKVSRAF
jgi:uncharacterized protein (TIGR02001 family)